MLSSLFSLATIRAAGAAAGEFLASMPSEVWAFLAGGLLVGGACAFGQPFAPSSPPPDVRTVVKKDRVFPGPMDPASWRQLEIFNPPPESVVVRDTVRVPERVLVEQSTNALPEARYDPDLLESPGLAGPLSYAVVPFEGGTEPMISVGPDEVSLRLVNPNTAGYMTYRYSVPDWTWRLSASASAEYAKGGDLTPRLGLNLSRRLGEYVVEGSGLIRADRQWWGGRITIERPLWTR